MAILKQSVAKPIVKKTAKPLVVPIDNTPNPVKFFILAEDNSYILTEASGKIVLED